MVVEKAVADGLGLDIDVKNSQGVIVVNVGYDTTEIFEKVNPSVVSINVYGGTSVSPIGSGTGIVMTEDGYIITNDHIYAEIESPRFFAAIL